MSLRLVDVSVDIDRKSIIRKVAFEVAPSEIVAVLGPSGSGKTTLLRAIAGLVSLSNGQIFLAGTDITAEPAYRRGIGYMFQDHALFPHRNVAENVEFGLRMAKMRKSARNERSAEVLELVGLGGFQKRDVMSLSGGERQRVALARAIATEPSLLLLDEPFSSLDRSLRERLWADLVKVLALTETACIHVTHDHTEALRSGDRLVVMDEGEVVQLGQPNDLWRTPKTEAIGRIVGPLNAIPVEILGSDELEAPWGVMYYQNLIQGPQPKLGKAKLLVRPDAFEILEQAPSTGQAIEVLVKNRNFLGTHAVLEVELVSPQGNERFDHRLAVLDADLYPSEVGSQIFLSIKEHSITISAT